MCLQSRNAACAAIDFIADEISDILLGLGGMQTYWDTRKSLEEISEEARVLQSVLTSIHHFARRMRFAIQREGVL